MSRRMARVLWWLGLGAIGAWFGRLLAHSKVPAPEGRWREVPEDEL